MVKCAIAIDVTVLCIFRYLSYDVSGKSMIMYDALPLNNLKSYREPVLDYLSVC